MGGNGIQQLLVERHAKAVLRSPSRAITGWKACRVLIAPLKLIDRGAMPCFVAA